MNKKLHKIVPPDGEDERAESSMQERIEVTEETTMLCGADDYDEDLQRKYEKVSSSCGTNKE